MQGQGKWRLVLAAVWGLGSQTMLAQSYELGREAITKMAGCYQVDYSYKEVEVLKPGYQPDLRVYDATAQQQVKEFLMVLDDQGSQLWLQHILFVSDEAGNLRFIMKHQGERWTFDKGFHYEYQGGDQWQAEPTSAPDLWTREVTSLTDGPRYSCSSPWQQRGGVAQWQCASFAPIPGRETRDMGRKDYNALARDTRLLSYPWGLLERQNNIKTIFADGKRTPLVREVGKTFSIALPASHCQAAQAWAQPRLAFWSLTRQVWQEIQDGQRPVRLAAVRSDHSQGLDALLGELEEESLGTLDSATARAEVKAKVRRIIEAFLS